MSHHLSLTVTTSTSPFYTWHLLYDLGVFHPSVDITVVGCWFTSWVSSVAIQTAGGQLDSILCHRILL